MNSWSMLRTHEKLTIGVAVVAVIVAFLSAVFTGLQWRAAERAVGVADRARVDANDAAKRSLAVAEKAREDVVAQAEQQRKDSEIALEAQTKRADRSNFLADRSARAAETTAKTAALQVEVADRPWVALAARISGPFTFLAQGGAVMPVVITMSNSGHSPASSLNLRSELVAPTVFDPLVERERLCEDAKQGETKYPRAYANTVLFPGVPAEEQYFLTIDKEQVLSTSKQLGGTIGPYIVLCLAYRPAYSEEIHRTAVVLSLRQDRTNTNPPVDTLIVPQGKQEGVPAERLHLFTVGSFAD